MKQQRYKLKLLALFLFSLFLLLAVYGVYSITTYGNRWFAYTHNPRIRQQKQNVVAGSIYDRAGVLLASTQNGQRVYQSSLAARQAVAHVLGDSAGHVANGVETFQTAYLYGFHASTLSLLRSAFTGETRRGDDVTLTIDSRLCTQIASFFSAHPHSAGHNGAAVVMNWRTGEVLAEISLPTFDPMDVASVPEDSEAFWNRATQSLYPPGSTFKIITTASALENLPDITTQPLSCTGDLTVQNQTIHDYGGSVHGMLTLKRAFAVSCNNAYALLALKLQDTALRATAASFGFGENFLFRDIVVENSVYPTTHRTAFELATTGFGQSGLGATPMHLCMVAAGIANGGVMMEPYLVRQAVGADGTRRTTGGPRVYRRATTAENAAVLAEYMRSVVTGGTGSRAAVNGLQVCGKTGSAESSLKGRAVTYGWFVGYIADDSLPFAVAVVVEDIPDGTGGGSVAAPIAKDIFTYLKNNAERVTQ